MDAVPRIFYLRQKERAPGRGFCLDKRVVRLYNHCRHFFAPTTVEKEIFFVKTLLCFIRKNAVLCVAALAAAATACALPPDAAYLGYFDFKTLTCLFCVLAIVCALRNIRFFYILAQRIVKVFGNARAAVMALVVITFVGSMLIANDMALLTFLPLGYYVLHGTGKEKYMAFTFIMQNIAANLGGMLTPFGNPQNLYLYSHFDIPTGEFTAIMAPHFALAVCLILLFCAVFVRPEPISVSGEETRLPPLRTAVYLLLFALAIGIVFRGIPYQIGLVVVPVSLLFLDRDALRRVDYPLLLTFVFFFIFAGNMARLPAVHRLLSGWLAKNTLLVSILSCQCISNVPTAILLSQFTRDYPHLLVGVNIGGTGTLIASLASLITYRTYVSAYPQNKGRYLALFSAMSFAFLAILTLFALWIG